MKVGIVVDAIEVCILKLVCVAWTYIQDHKDAKKQNLLYQLYLQSSHYLDGLWYAV